MAYYKYRIEQEIDISSDYGEEDKFFSPINLLNDVVSKRINDWIAPLGVTQTTYINFNSLENEKWSYSLNKQHVVGQCFVLPISFSMRTINEDITIVTYTIFSENKLSKDYIFDINMSVMFLEAVELEIKMSDEKIPLEKRMTHTNINIIEL